LGQRSHWQRFPSSHQFYSSHESRTYCAHSRKQDSEFSLGGRDFGRFLHAAPLVHDHRAINGRIKMKTRFAAAEARCGPKQTNHDEGRAQDLQIYPKEVARPTF
jgi:hypothetical protein